MQKFKESFRANTPVEIGQLQPASRSSTSAGKKKRRNKSRGRNSWHSARRQKSVMCSHIQGTLSSTSLLLLSLVALPCLLSPLDDDNGCAARLELTSMRTMLPHVRITMNTSHCKAVMGEYKETSIAKTCKQQVFFSKVSLPRIKENQSMLVDGMRTIV